MKLYMLVIDIKMDIWCVVILWLWVNGDIKMRLYVDFIFFNK